MKYFLILVAFVGFVIVEEGLETSLFVNCNGIFSQKDSIDNTGIFSI